MKELVLEYIENLENLPTLPEVSMQIMKDMQDPDISLNQAVQSLRKDPSLVMRIMKVANSARYGGAMKVTALEVAAGRLGISMIKQLVLIDGVMSLFPPSRGGYETKNYWEHSLTTAIIAENLVSKSLRKVSFPLPKKIECFTAGVLHGVGILILEMGFPKATYLVAEKVTEQGLTIFNAEQEVIGISNQECGEVLSRHWQLPPLISDAIRWHYSPDNAPDSSRVLCDIIYIAKYIANHQDKKATVFCPESMDFKPEVFERFKLQSLSTQEMTDMANEALENAVNII
ncbi:MAG: HDOD domain-containing protein [Lentisphaeraceae bacterium]|nr:HDOD domain-containing protein [Lentisphaeraceae bacterium]